MSHNLSWFPAHHCHDVDVFPGLCVGLALKKPVQFIQFCRLQMVRDFPLFHIIFCALFFIQFITLDLFMPYIFPTPRPLTPEKYVFIACFLTSSRYALPFGSIVYTLPHSLHLQRWVPDGLCPTFIWFSIFPQYRHFFHSSSFALLISLLFYYKMSDLGNPLKMAYESMKNRTLESRLN